MGDRDHCPPESALASADHVTVVFHKLASHGEKISESESDGGRCCGDSEPPEERAFVRGRRNHGGDAVEEIADDKSPEGGERETLCPPASLVNEKASSAGGESASKVKPKRYPGLGLFYAFLATVFFSIISLIVKTIQGVHAIEISGIRCFFQMLFIVPLLIYNKTGFLGPRDKRLYLTLRGFLGSNAMILLFYAVQQMPLADATVIIFSNPVFTSLLAWAFLKEKCTIWDCVFTVFTLTGVILIARPPFLFGENIKGIEGNYANHIKGTIAAFAGAIGAACTMVILRKIGKSVHYLLSVWYYAVIGFVECLIMVSVLGQWELPPCGCDRWMLMLIAVLGIAGQSFLTKALQLEKAGPVALMRTVDVVLAFFFQFVFLGQKPSFWSLGGALCIVVSTSGVALKKWYSSSRKS
ncbi:solute carrier family 35 member G1 [Corythoichthys intestinalis]|uniref:solute carrier family 35 member G1 n=1 Tax=Corythoichthys intestinalis TaxID=161448 RepID=UPI0025A57979|nr:solute carrier family 35 member G1 [Corythoichthys intestinalis]XP_061807174.1 solute carrier family 35 member G1-like [Nerophis lumbriciformis]